MPGDKPRLGDILLAAKAVGEAELERGLAHAQQTGCRLGAALIELGVVRADTVAAALARQHGVAPATAAQLAAVAEEMRGKLSAREAAHYCVVPLGTLRGSNTLAVAMRDPHDLEALDALRFATGGKLQTAVASEFVLRRTVERLYGEAAAAGNGGLAAAPAAAPSEALDLHAGGAVSGTMAPEFAPPGTATVAAAAPSAGTMAPIVPRAGRGTLAPEGLAPATEKASASWDDYQGGGRSILHEYRKLIIAGVVVIAALVAFKIVHDKRQRNRIVSLSGLYVAKHPGIELDLLDSGWQYRAKEDMTDNKPGVTTKGSTFFRGPDVKDPDAAMVLIRANGRFPAMTDGNFNTVMGGVQAGLQHGVAIRNIVTSGGRCERSTDPAPISAVCRGNGMLLNRSYDLLAYIWMADDANMMFAFFLHKPSLPNMEREWAQILKSVRPID